MISKRRLSSLLKQTHGDRWSRGLTPQFDKRGYASVAFYRFNPSIAVEIAHFQPVYWLECCFEKENELADVQATVPILLRGWKDHLEYVELNYVTDVTATNHKRLSQALATSVDCLSDLPQLDQFVVVNLEFSDDHLAAVCKNRRLAQVDIRNATITTRSFHSLAKCPILQAILIERCPHVSAECQNALRKLVPWAKLVRIK